MRNALMARPAHASPAPATGAAAALQSGALTLVRDPMRLFLFVLTILSVSRIHQHYPFIAKLRPALLLTLATLALAWAHPRYLTRRNVLNLWPTRNVAILAVLACCSAAFGISLGNSARFILDSYGKTLLYSFLLVLAIRCAEDLYTFVWAYVISSGILACFALFVFKLSSANANNFARLDDLYMYDANDLGLVLLVGLALTMLLLHVSRGVQRAALLVILVGIMGAVARSGSRGAFVAFVAVALAALVLVNGISAPRRVLILLSAIIPLVLFAPPGYWAQMGTMLSPQEDYNLTSQEGRKAIIKRGIGYVSHYPLFGLGINNFSRAECTLSAGKVAEGKGAKCTAPHNSYVQAGAELGIPGFFVWSSLVFGGIVSLLSLRRRLPRSWRRGTDKERFLYASTHFLAIALIGFGVSAFFLSFAWLDIIYILAAFLSGLFIAVRAQLEASPVRAGHASMPTQRQTRRGAKRGWRVVASAARFGR